MHSILWLPLALFLLSPFFLVESKEVKHWIVYYNDKAQPEAFDLYDLIVFDSQYHPRIERLRESKKIVLGYISLGEVENNREHFDAVKEEGILLDENKNWKGSYFVDVRDPRWGKRVIEELIPRILLQRFDGLFFDTLDNPGHLEELDPVKYAGMKQGAIDLVRGIRKHYPSIKIMLNRAYSILDEVADVIDMELGESIYSDYDFENKIYQKVDHEEYMDQVAILKNASEKRPSLKIYTLDYWDPSDKETIAEIYQTERSQGFIPYVSTVELDKIIPEPVALEKSEK